MPVWRRVLCVAIGGAVLYAASFPALVVLHGGPRPVLVGLAAITLGCVGVALVASGLLPERAE